MNRFAIFILLCATVLLARNAERGIPVSVTLVSGAKQQAEYLGASGDTVHLGGFIDGAYTVVHILRKRISALRDSAGNEIGNAQADTILEAASDPGTHPEEAATGSETPEQAPAAIDLSGKALLFPVSRRPIDSALAERIRDLELQLLRERGEKPISVSPGDFPECRDSPCIAKTAKERGAVSVWTAEIEPARHQDSLELRMHRFLLESGSSNSEHLVLSSRFATIELLSEGRFLHLTEKLEGTYREPEKSKSTKSHIFVETDPEDATLSYKAGAAICRTPCAFAVADTGKVELEAYWNVENTLWANKAVVLPVPGDTAKISLRLKRVKPEVEIRTRPGGASIFESGEISPHSRPIGYTPKTFFSQEPGPAELHLWKEGFRDSVIHFQVSAMERTIVEIDLDTLTDPKALEGQKTFAAIQKRLFWGHLALGSAIAPAAAGALLLYIAHRDLDKAKEYKSELEMPSSAKGENFQALVDKNHRYADRSKSERYVGTGFLILAGGLFAAGIVLSF